MARILVTIVTYNARPWIDKCLESLRTSSVPVDVLVVDNASPDGTADYIHDFHPDVELLENASNSGFGAANNIGLRRMLEGKYDYVYLLNQDAWVEKDTLEILLRNWKDGYGILSPVQLSAKGKMDKQFEKKCGKLLKDAPKGLDGAKRVVEVPFVMAAHWLVSRKAVETVGGFSPAFSQYGEDDNYIDRLHHFGLKVGVVPDAKAVHDRDGRDKAPKGSSREVKDACKKAARERRMRLKCVATVVKLSNPDHSPLARIFVEPLELLGMTVKNFSLIPVKYIPTLVRRYPELLRLRKASRKGSAFLDI